MANNEPSSLRRYEQLAEDILAIYRTGDASALQRINEYTQQTRTPEYLRSQLQQRLGKQDDADISLADAQLFIARVHNFESWQALAEYIKTFPAGSQPTRTPVKLFHLDEKGDEQTAGSARDWDTIVGLMTEKRIPGLNAEGQMTDAVLERISRLDHVTDLNLGGSRQLTDAGLKHLARMPQLQHLDLIGCSITDYGMEVLRHLPELKSLVMCHHQGITDAGTANLINCQHLENVDLMGTPTGDGTVMTLTGKPKLRRFKAGNFVTDAGLALLHEFPIFKTWQGGEVKMSLTSPEAEPNFLWLNLKAFFTDKGLANLVGLDGLFAVSMFGSMGGGPFDSANSLVTPAGLLHLSKLPNLGWLGCTNELCDDEAMRYISEIPRLRFLMCQDAVAGDDGFAALSRSQTIEYIWGRRCHNLQGRGFAAMAAMPVLRSLSVSCKNVDDEGLSALPRFPALRELMPMDVPDEGYRHIGRCEQLESLVLMYCGDTTDAATENIAGLPRLKKYFASYAQISDRSLEILGQILSLVSITMYGCAGVTNVGLAFLTGLPNLRELDVGGLPNITPEGTTIFPAYVRVKI